MDAGENGSFYHFSVDDVFDSLVELTDSGQRLFDNPFFAFLKQLHDSYGTKVSLYLFYRGEIRGKVRTLQEVTEREKHTFEQNRWIRFGPHSLDYGNPPYAQTPSEQRKTFDGIYREVHRFAGAGSTSRWVRLHYFSESYELASYFHQRNVRALLATDKSVGSHRLPEGMKLALLRDGVAEYEGMRFIRTYLRAENLTNDRIPVEGISQIVDSLVISPGFVTLMTHEGEILRSEVRCAIATAIGRLREKNLRSR